jgi:hypothetical protein
VFATSRRRWAEVGVRILATSREFLAVRGERGLSTPPLDVADDPAHATASDAVELFRVRASAAAPGFDADAADVATVAQVCRRLDGLPLAIELAAARLRALSLEQIAQRLDDRFRLLGGGERTLEAVVAWSYDLLTDAEREVFVRLVVFPADFGLEAAEMVVADAVVERGDVLDLLLRGNGSRPGYRMIDATDLEAQPLKRELQRFGARQPACRAVVDAQYGIGGLIAVAVWTELGDCRRFRRSEQVVRHTGLDVTVDSSDRRRAGGFLSRQGPETLRWALYEAAKNSSHHRSPDHHYYAAVKERHDGKIAAISVARQFARRCYHVLRNLDPDVVYAMPN